MKPARLARLGWILGPTCAAAWFAAQVGHSVSAQEQPVLRVTTRLVVVNVIVHDKQGAPVTGLTREDFTILDNGKEQEIAEFSVQSSRAAQPRPVPLPPNVFSNRVSRQGDVVGGAAVIFLDAQGTRLEDQAYARGQLIKFLSRIQPQDRVALYVLGSSLQVIQDFTSDPAPLLEALRQERGRVGVAPGGVEAKQGPETGLLGLSGAGARAAARLDASLSSLTRRIGPGQIRAPWDPVPAAIEAIANHLAGLPGRKSIIWITGRVLLPQAQPRGHPASEENPVVADAIRHMLQVVNEDDVALYLIDARGLFTDPGYNAENQQVAVGAGSLLDGLNLEIQGMSYYASETGGRAFYNTNDLSGAMRTALDDSEPIYTLGYYPSHGQWNGEYRPIRVRVKRQGLDVRYRRGYFALAELPLETVTDRKQLLKEAAARPLDATEVGVTVRVTPFKALPGTRLRIEVSLDPRDLTFHRVNGRRTGSFDILAGQYSKRGRSVGGTTETVGEDLKDETYQQMMQKGLTITLYGDLVRGAQELRVVVRDSQSGSLGSVRVPLRHLLSWPSGRAS